MSRERQTARAAESTERGKIDDATGLSPRLVFEVVLREGRAELGRPPGSLMWSGIAAGLLISASVLGEAVLRAHLPDAQWRPLVENFGYSLGFLLVIIGRMQLFTENTITTVLPVIHEPEPGCLWALVRLWTVVLVANMVGASVAAWFFALGGVLSPEIAVAVADLSRHATAMGPETSFLRAIPAGILIAAIVWMLPSAGGGGFAVIVTFTWLIAAGDFTHVIAGSVELAYRLFTTDLGLVEASLSFFLPVLAGNVIGGTLVFALLAWGQVRREVMPDAPQVRTGRAGRPTGPNPGPTSGPTPGPVPPR